MITVNKIVIYDNNCIARRRSNQSAVLQECDAMGNTKFLQLTAEYVKTITSFQYFLLPLVVNALGDKGSSESKIYSVHATVLLQYTVYMLQYCYNIQRTCFNTVTIYSTHATALLQYTAYMLQYCSIYSAHATVMLQYTVHMLQ